jgi:hypothetical protein
MHFNTFLVKKHNILQPAVNDTRKLVNGIYNIVTQNVVFFYYKSPQTKPQQNRKK